MHPDPTVCRVGRDFYLACSSFEYFPGVPLYTSRDLVHWTPVGHALTRRSQLDLRGVPSSGGVYAPTLRHHEGTFFLVTTLVGRGNFVVTAPSPRGPWSDPVWLDEDGIDPSLAFLDGRVFYTRNGRGADPDHPFVYQGELTLAGGPPIAVEPRVIWRGTGGVWPEAPHLYRRGRLVLPRCRRGWHELRALGRGRPRHRPVRAVRALSARAAAHAPRPAPAADPGARGTPTSSTSRTAPPGPCCWRSDRAEAGTTTSVARRSSHPSVGATTDGRGCRPSGLGSRDRLSRRPRCPTRPGDSEFRPGRLPTGWLFVRNPARGCCTLRERPGFLRLWGTAATIRDVASPALVCRRQQHFEATARARLEFEPVNPGEQAGLCLRANEDFNARARRGARPGRPGAPPRRHAARRDVDARAARARGRTGDARAPRRRRASTGSRAAPAVSQELGRVPTRSFSAETILASTGRHHFTGAMIGLYATGGGTRATVPADVEWFEYTA